MFLKSHLLCLNDIKVCKWPACQTFSTLGLNHSQFQACSEVDLVDAIRGDFVTRPVMAQLLINV